MDSLTIFIIVYIQMGVHSSKAVSPRQYEIKAAIRGSKDAKLIQYSARGDVDAVTRLIVDGTNVNAVGVGGFTALTHAAISGETVSPKPVLQIFNFSSYFMCLPIFSKTT